MTIEQSKTQDVRAGSIGTAESRHGSSASSESHHSVHDGVQKIKEGGQKIKEGGRESLEATRELGQELWFEGREKAKGAVAQLEDYVSENPMRSVLWAAGAGAVLGMLLGRRG
ncbi:MAG: DUF883 family protein [Planctomycetaceae bacterium]|nr:DUF883 family protein [Planctomycetaceae bacterium]